MLTERLKKKKQTNNGSKRQKKKKPVARAAHFFAVILRPTTWNFQITRFMNRELKKTRFQVTHVHGLFTFLSSSFVQIFS